MPLVTVLSSPIQNSQHYFSSFMPSVVLSWKSSHTQSHISPRAGQAPCMEQLVSIVPWREQKRRTEYAICQDSTLLSGLVSITASCALARSTYYSPRTKLLCQITCRNLGCWLVLLAVTLHPSPGMAYVRACMDGPISPRPWSIAWPAQATRQAHIYKYGPRQSQLSPSNPRSLFKYASSKSQHHRLVCISSDWSAIY